MWVETKTRQLVDITIENVNRVQVNHQKHMPRQAEWVVFRNGFNLHFDFPEQIERSYKTKRDAIEAFNNWKEGVK